LRTEALAAEIRFDDVEQFRQFVVLFEHLHGALEFRQKKHQIAHFLRDLHVVQSSLSVMDMKVIQNHVSCQMGQMQGFRADCRQCVAPKEESKHGKVFDVGDLNPSHMDKNHVENISQSWLEYPRRLFRSGLHADTVLIELGQFRESDVAPVGHHQLVALLVIAEYLISSERAIDTREVIVEVLEHCDLVFSGQVGEWREIVAHDLREYMYFGGTSELRSGERTHFHVFGLGEERGEAVHVVVGHGMSGLADGDKMKVSFPHLGQNLHFLRDDL